MAARIAYEFRACRTMDWCAASVDMIAFINSSGSAGECMNCSFVFAAACLRRTSDSIIFRSAAS